MHEQLTAHNIPQRFNLASVNASLVSERGKTRLGRSLLRRMKVRLDCRGAVRASICVSIPTTQLQQSRDGRRMAGCNCCCELPLRIGLGIIARGV